MIWLLFLFVKKRALPRCEWRVDFTKTHLNFSGLKIWIRQIFSSTFFIIGMQYTSFRVLFESFWKESCAEIWQKSRRLYVKINRKNAKKWWEFSCIINAVNHKSLWTDQCVYRTFQLAVMFFAHVFPTHNRHSNEHFWHCGTQSTHLHKLWSFRKPKFSCKRQKFSTE